MAKSKPANAPDKIDDIVGQMLTSIRDGRPIQMFLDMRDLRKAINEAAKENSWDLVESAFARATAVATEMLIRSQLEMHERINRHDMNGGGAATRYPDITGQAERFERITGFLLDIAERYARVRHVVTISRRPVGDPKLLSIDDAPTTTPKRRRSKKARKRKAARA